MDKRERFRVCAVCGKRHGPTFGFKTTLRRVGIMTGDKAVPACVIKAQHEFERRNGRAAPLWIVLEADD
jgi:hypothetical protein